MKLLKIIEEYRATFPEKDYIEIEFGMVLLGFLITEIDEKTGARINGKGPIFEVRIETNAGSVKIKHYAYKDNPTERDFERFMLEKLLT
jgi:hypothetical protein